MLSNYVLPKSHEKPFRYSLKLLYTNFKLNTMGFLVSICVLMLSPFSLNHIVVLLTGCKIQLTLQDFVIEILNFFTMTFHILLNYFIEIGQFHMWDCRRIKLTQLIQRFEVKIIFRYEAQRHIYVMGKDCGRFKKKSWCSPSYNAPPCGVQIAFSSARYQVITVQRSLLCKLSTV